ncbi:MAG: glycosyltransferase family 2 protein [Acutalibacteraceae bacterium]
MNTLWLVIPCYNEKEVLPETSQRLKVLIEDLIKRGKISENSKIAFVNDGSKDNTWQIISDLHKSSPLFTGICLSRNRGHQNALLAGLSVAVKYADAVVSLDADLQDDINVIEKFVDEWHAGNDVVYGVRSARDTDTFFKRFTAEGFYKIMKKMGVEIVFNHADYRLMSKRALEGLLKFDEVNLFLRGIVPQVGYPSTIVTYERNERFAGESKYNLRKMLSLAFNGITSFSFQPLRLAVVLSTLSFIVSVFMAVWCIVDACKGVAVPIWASVGISIWLVSSMILLVLGIIGEYIGNIYMETKHRPRFIIESVLLDDNEK